MGGIELRLVGQRNWHMGYLPSSVGNVNSVIPPYLNLTIKSHCDDSEQFWVTSVWDSYLVADFEFHGFVPVSVRCETILPKALCVPIPQFAKQLFRLPQVLTL